MLRVSVEPGVFSVKLRLQIMGGSFFMSAVFDLSIIINYRKNFIVSLANENIRKLKKTGTISSERRILKMAGDVPF